MLALGSIALMALHRRRVLPGRGPHGDRLRRDALRAGGVLGPARGFRRPAHLPFALPDVGRHALRGRGSGRRGASWRSASPTPQRFLGQSLALVPELPGSRGGRLEDRGGRGRVRRASAGRREVRLPRAGARVPHRRSRFRPALFLRMRLLAQVVGEFYESKRREARIQRNAYLQAVHETGARLTHDIKNLLAVPATRSPRPRRARGRSTRPTATCSSASSRSSRGASRPRWTSCDRRRWRPAKPLRPARAWWEDVERRHAGDGLQLEATIDGYVVVPATLFDAFLDNCIDNVRGKGVNGARTKASFTVPGTGARGSTSRTRGGRAGSGRAFLCSASRFPARQAARASASASTRWRAWPPRRGYTAEIACPP
ncbi:MAG: hypothetical protein MZW92_11970 [Comamonadaceae bacterium]|nr:hypothetical protein [Comamonadaceae bacterium]